jgi:hypothetical protein
MSTPNTDDGRNNSRELFHTLFCEARETGLSSSRRCSWIHSVMRESAKDKDIEVPI